MAVVLHWLVNRGQSEVEALGGFGIFICVVGLGEMVLGDMERGREEGRSGGQVRFSGDTKRWILLIFSPPSSLQFILITNGETYISNRSS